MYSREVLEDELSYLLEYLLDFVCDKKCLDCIKGYAEDIYILIRVALSFMLKHIDRYGKMKKKEIYEMCQC